MTKETEKVLTLIINKTNTIKNIEKNNNQPIN